MRQRQFRGISYDGQGIFGTSIIQRKDWVGDIWVSRVFLLNGDACNHTPETSAFVEVKPNTVGEWIGLQDKDDQDIYEGDIVRAYFPSGKFEVLTVEFADAAFLLKKITTGRMWLCNVDYPMEVIGNIYANPELLTK